MWSFNPPALSPRQRCSRTHAWRALPTRRLVSVAKRAPRAAVQPSPRRRRTPSRRTACHGRARTDAQCTPSRSRALDPAHPNECPRRRPTRMRGASDWRRWDESANAKSQITGFRRTRRKRKQTGDRRDKWFHKRIAAT